MSQNEEARAVKERADALHCEEREEQAFDDELNDSRLRADQHAGQAGVLIPGTERRLINAAEIKEIYDLLPDFHRDELRRLSIVEPGVALELGDIFVDLRYRIRGELTAHGEEIVTHELLVPKRDTDYVLWNKLLTLPA